MIELALIGLVFYVIFLALKYMVNEDLSDCDNRDKDD